MSRDKEDRFEKTGTSPLWAVRIFSNRSDAVAGHGSFAAVGMVIRIGSKTSEPSFAISPNLEQAVKVDSIFLLKHLLNAK